MQMLLRIRISGKAHKATILVICNHLLRSQKILWQGREGGSGGRLHLGVLSSPQHRGRPCPRAPAAPWWLGPSSQGFPDNEKQGIRENLRCVDRAGGGHSPGKPAVTQRRGCQRKYLLGILLPVAPASLSPTSRQGHPTLAAFSWFRFFPSGGAPGKFHPSQAACAFCEPHLLITDTAQTRRPAT